MKKEILTICAVMLFLCVLFSSSTVLAATATGGACTPVRMMSLDRQPLLFIHNDGQLDKKVKYYERGATHATFFAEDGICLSLFRQQRETADSGLSRQQKGSAVLADNVRLSFVNAKAKPVISSEGILPTKYNYYIGNDPARWREGISTYKTIKYTEIYKNIDLKVYGNNRQLEYDVIVKPGGDPEVVNFKYEGAESLTVNTDGELEIKLNHGTLIQKSPALYQEISGQRVEVAGHFKLLSDNRYTFEIADYDTRKPLIIDPVIEYSRYLSGDGQDWGNAVAVDSAGNAYVTGKTDSTYFPSTSFPHDVTTYSNDIFVYKVDPSGARVYVTVFGGTAYDGATGATPEAGYDIAVDSSGYAHITGPTHSNDFPIWAGGPGLLPFQSTHGGYTPGDTDMTSTTTDAFYVALNGNGYRVYSSYIGGANWERGNAIAVDNSSNVYIAGQTAPYHYSHSSDFPIAGANIIQSAYGGDDDINDSFYPADAFVTKIHFDAATPSNTALVFSTYFGGTGNDVANGIALDDLGDIYITGATNSTNLPGVSPSSIQSSVAGGNDAFITKINSAGTAIDYSTYLGGNRSDFGKAIAVDTEGNAYVAGDLMPPGSSSPPYNFPLVNPVQSTTGGGEWDAFVTKINTAGSAIDYSTFLGGSMSDKARGIAVDSHGSAFIAGETWSADYPIKNPISGHGAILGSTGNEMDGFITRLSPLGNNIIYSTFLGGGGSGDDDAGTDSIHGIVVDDNGNAWVTGMTTSHHFPGPNGPILGFDLLTDGFISKISDDSPMPPEVFSVTPPANAVNILISTSPISATFTRDMDINSFDGHMSLVPSSGGSPVAGSIGNNGWHEITFTPSADLEYDTRYTATITTEVTDTDGTSLPADYSWEFTTEPAPPDTTPPTILSTVPDTSDDENIVRGVPVNSMIKVAFSEAMDPATITSDNLILWSWDQAILTDIIYSAVVSYNSVTHIANINPLVDLPYGTEISLMVSYRVADLAENTLGNSYYGAFKTECDPQAPTIISSSPVNYATDIPVDAVLTFTFDADMDPATLNASGINIYRLFPYVPIDGSFSYEVATRILSFTPTSLLPVGNWISALFYESVTDTAGRHVCYPSEYEPLFVYFATVDEDGISTAEEQGPDGDNPWYDGNGDWNADCGQANVTSLHTEDGSKYVTLSCPAGQLLQDVSPEANPSAGDTPDGITFPFGFFNFTIAGLDEGGATSLTLNLPEDETVNSYWKYGPTPENPNPHWYAFMYDSATGTGAVINGSEIVLYFVDGGRGDDNLIPDAKIIEPGAAGFIDITPDFDIDQDVDGSDLAELVRRLDVDNLPVVVVVPFAAAYGY